MARKTDKPVDYVRIEATEEIKEMVRPAIACRIAWLEEFAVCPRPEGMTPDEIRTLWQPHHVKLQQIWREQAAALNAHKWEVREWILSRPEAYKGARAFDFIVDGVRIKYDEKRGSCFEVHLFPADLTALRAKEAA